MKRFYHKRIKKIIKRPLISGSLLVALGNTAGNLFNYLFHLSMGRLLPPASYGILTALISFISIFGVFSLTISTVVTKFISTYRTKEDLSDVSHILRQMLKRVALIIIIAAAVYIFIHGTVQSFLHIQDNFLLNILAIVVLLTFLGGVNSGALQGLLMFKVIAILTSSGGLLRFLIAIGLVYFGFGLRGAVVAFFLSFFIPYILSFIPLKKYFAYQESKKKLHFGKVVNYSLPAFLAIVGLSMFISIDVILVKHFFTEVESGMYAALSVIGRVIFFGTSSISLVMFPIIAAKFAKKEEYNSIFLLSLMLVLGAGIFASFLYFSYPSLIINLFYSNNKYLSVSGDLGYMGVLFSLYSIVSLLINFFLSISKTKISILAVLASIFQIVLIWNFHSTIRQVIFSSILTMTLLVIMLISYYLFNAFKKK